MVFETDRTQSAGRSGEGNPDLLGDTWTGRQVAQLQPGRYERYGEPRTGDQRIETGLPAGADPKLQQWATQYATTQQGINDIYAGYGKPFTLPAQQARYAQMQGYQPRADFKETDIKPEDRQKIDQLVQQRNGVLGEYRQFRQGNPIQKVDGSYVIADSNTRQLTPQELQGKTPQQLEMARNEIYARHGWRFDRIDLAEHFGARTWYTEKGREAPKFNHVETLNLNTLLAAEAAARGIRRGA